MVTLLMWGYAAQASLGPLEPHQNLVPNEEDSGKCSVNKNVDTCSGCIACGSKTKEDYTGAAIYECNTGVGWCQGVYPDCYTEYPCSGGVYVTDAECTLVVGPGHFSCAISIGFVCAPCTVGAGHAVKEMNCVAVPGPEH